MDENPYKAPTEEGAASRQKAFGLGRRTALVLAFPCLLIAAFCLIGVGLAAGELAAGPNAAAAQMYLVLAAFFLVNAATWTATAWALWTKRTRAVIAFLLADIFALAIGYLG